MSELIPRLVLGPNKQDSSDNGRYEVVEPPPALDSRAVNFEDTLAYRECAVVPDEKEYQYQLEWPAILKHKLIENSASVCLGHQHTEAQRCVFIKECFLSFVRERKIENIV